MGVMVNQEESIVLGGLPLTIGTSAEECVWSKWNQVSRGLVPSSCDFSSWKVGRRKSDKKGCCLGMAVLVNRAYSSHCLEGRCEDVVSRLFLKCNNWRSAWITSWSLDLREINNLGRNPGQLNNVTKDHSSYFCSFCPIFLPLALSYLAWYKAQDCQRLLHWGPWVRVPCESGHRGCKVWTTA